MRIVFGDCELDSGRRLLLRHGRPTPLSPKAFQLLEVLIERRPEAVGKSELPADAKALRRIRISFPANSK